MIRWPRRLHTQLALAMAVALALSAVFVFVTMTWHYAVLEARIDASLTPEQREALSHLHLSQPFTRTQLDGLTQVASFDPWFEMENLLFAGLSLLSVALGAAVGALLGARIAQPIAAVSSAAQRLADGDLSARASAERAGTGEVGLLLRNFNLLAEQLEHTDRELAATASAVAHELRTPLTILRTRIEAIDDGVRPANGEEMKTLLGQVDHLSAIVDDISVLSLASANQLPIRRVRMDLSIEVEAVLRAVNLALERAQVEVEKDFRPAFAEVDPGRLRQVVHALLDNVVRYATEGGVVRIETFARDGYSFLRVLDRGPGLPSDDPDVVFDRFWRAESSRSRITGGSGLGLAVVKAIAEAHGGRVMAANRDDGGAAFSVLFPIR